MSELYWVSLFSISATLITSARLLNSFSCCPVVSLIVSQDIGWCVCQISLSTCVRSFNINLWAHKSQGQVDTGQIVQVSFEGYTLCIVLYASKSGAGWIMDRSSQNLLQKGIRPNSVSELTEWPHFSQDCGDLRICNTMWPGLVNYPRIEQWFSENGELRRSRIQQNMYSQNLVKIFP